VSQTSGQKPRSTDHDSSTWVDEPAPTAEREDLVGWNTTKTRPAESGNTEETDEPAGATKLDDPAKPTDVDEPADSPRPARADRSGWPALPTRAVRRGSPLLAVRTPIKPRAKWILYALSFAVPFAGWWILSEIEVFPAQYFPTPEKSFAALIRLAEEGTLFSDLWDTTRRILVGYGISIAISAPLGFAIGTWAAGRALFEPFISLIRYIPATALIPLLLLWLGIDEAPKIALLTLATVFFNTMMIADVVKSVPMPMINVSYTLGARRGEVLRKVILPHSLPGTIDAIRVNLAAAWNFVVVSELISSTTGLGRRIAQAQRFTRTDEIFAMLIVIGIVGVIFDVTLRLLRNRVGRWMV
jgi:NitT/TauT family transport system permease protein